MMAIQDYLNRADDRDPRRLPAAPTVQQPVPQPGLMGRPAVPAPQPVTNAPVSQPAPLTPSQTQAVRDFAPHNYASQPRPAGGLMGQPTPTGPQQAPQSAPQQAPPPTPTVDRAARFAQNQQRGADLNRLMAQYGLNSVNQSVNGAGALSQLAEAYNQLSRSGRFSGTLDEYIAREVGAVRRDPSMPPQSQTLELTMEDTGQPASAPPSMNSRFPIAPTPGTQGRGIPGPGQPGSAQYMERTRPYVPPTGASIDAGQLPGATEGINYNSTNDLWTSLMTGLGSRYQNEFGNGIGGNSVGNDGSWSMPEWMRNLSGRYNEADTNAATRQVQGDETVQGRLAGLMREDNELNRIAVDRANEQAAERGMLGSSVAAGAALRASREAMLPIAQQDAQWYGQTSRDNMDALNRDALADQQGRLGLLGQETSTAANLLDSATNRRHQTSERLTDRVWQSWENELGYRRASLDREDQQGWNEYQSGLNRSFDRTTQLIQQQFQGDQAAMDRQQRGVETYFNALFSREGMLSNALNAIYSNPNLTPAQQQLAARNAQAFYQGQWESWNQTFAAGIPQIFVNPYTMQQPPPGPPPPRQAPGQPGQPPAQPAPTPGAPAPSPVGPTPADPGQPGPWLPPPGNLPPDEEPIIEPYPRRRGGG